MLRRRLRMLSLGICLVAAAALPAAASPAASASAPGFTAFKVPVPLNELAAGPDGNLWFDRNLGGNYTTDVGKVTTTGKITVYHPSFSIDHSFPGRIAVGSDGNLWFNLEGEATRAGVGRMSTTGGKVAAFPSPDACVYCSNESVAAGPNGEIWVGQEFNVIRRYDTNGDLLGSIDLSKWQMPPANVDAIVKGPDGNMWFSAGDWIGAVSPSGVPVGKWLTPSAHPNIQDLIVGPDKALWFCDFDPTVNKIGRITTSGQITEFTTGLPPKAGVLRMTVGPDGAIWFTESNYHSIGRITTAGVITQVQLPAAYNAAPAGIALGSDHNLWITVPGYSAVVRMTLGPACVVPALTGLRLPAATAKLKKSGCALGAVHRIGHRAKGVVVRQAPAANLALRHGAKVSVTLK